MIPNIKKWVLKNVLVTNRILNSMEGGIAKSFKYLDTAKELWVSIKTAYAQKRNNAKVLELKKKLLDSNKEAFGTIIFNSELYRKN